CRRRAGEVDDGGAGPAFIPGRRRVTPPGREACAPRPPAPRPSHPPIRRLGADLRELLAEITTTRRVISTQPPSSLLTTPEGRGCIITPANVRAMKELVDHNEPYVRWSAVVVGLTGGYLAGFLDMHRLSRRR